MTRYHIQVWGTKTFKTHLKVSAKQYKNICAAGKRNDIRAINDIIIDEVDYDWSDDAIKLERIEIDLYAEDDTKIATDLELI